MAADSVLLESFKVLLGQNFRRDLAEQLRVHRSFLHAVEAGRRKLPPARRLELEMLLREMTRTRLKPEDPRRER